MTVKNFDERYLAPGISGAALVDNLMAGCKKLQCLPTKLDISDPPEKSIACMLKALDTYYSTKNIDWSSSPNVTPCDEPYKWASACDGASMIWRKTFRPVWPSRWKYNDKGLAARSLILNLSDIRGVYDQYAATIVDNRSKYVDCLYAGSQERSSVLGDVVNNSASILTKDYIDACISQGIKKLGFIVTTRTMERLPDAGHWMALSLCIDVSDKKNFGVTFFDSLAQRDADSFEADLETYTDDLRACFPDIEVPCRRIPPGKAIQRKLSPVSCGLYVLHFLIEHLVNDQSLDEILTNKDFDDGVIDNTIRHIYFPKPVDE